jgi:hypothetical protein
MQEAQTSESELIQRISKARGNAEPEIAPTESLEAVDVSDIETQGEIAGEAEAENVEAGQAFESEELDVAENEEANTDDDGGDLYVEYKGREINLKDIEEWEKGNLRQADYTRKTTEVAESRKKLDADREVLDQQLAELQSKVAEVDAIIAAETLSDEDIKEMREYEPERYIEYQERLESRKKAIESAKELKPSSAYSVETERAKLVEANPQWLEDGKQTQAFIDDMSLVSSYAKSVGYSDDEIGGIQQAHHLLTLLDAAKYREGSKKNAALEKRVRKAPVVTKPRAATKANIQTKIEAAQAQLKKTGKYEDAVKLRQLKRQL